MTWTPIGNDKRFGIGKKFLIQIPCSLRHKKIHFLFFKMLINEEK